MRSFLLVILLLLLAGAAWVVHARVTSRAIDGLGCDPSEGTSYHVHVSLTILTGGRTVLHPPGGVGIDYGHLCLYWVHTHDASGIIHIEAPQRVTPTLGAFFDVWGVPLTPQRVWTISLRPPGCAAHAGCRTLRAFVNGKRFAGNPRSIPLKRHTEVVLEIGPPFIPPPPFNFHGY